MFEIRASPQKQKRTRSRNRGARSIADHLYNPDDLFGQWPDYTIGDFDERHWKINGLEANG
jgi:hypothetical protein